MPWKLGDKVINDGTGWADSDGIRHPTNWNIWTDDEKKAKGLKWEDPSPQKAPHDTRFYSGRKANGDLVEKKIADILWVDSDGKAVTDPMTGKQGATQGLKSLWTDTIKKQAHDKLSKTDWLVVRKAETSTAIPSDIATYREKVRTASKTIEDKIDACDTFAKFKALFDPPVDSDGMATGAPPISDWPSEVN